MLIQQIWKWSRAPITSLHDMLEEKNVRLDVGRIKFELPGVLPYTKKVEQEAEELVDLVSMALQEGMKKYPILEEVDGAHLAILLDVICALQLDLPVVVPAWKDNVEYKRARRIVDTLEDFLFQEVIDKIHHDCIGNVISKIFDWVWWKRDKQDGCEHHWYMGNTYDTYEKWLDAVRTHRATLKA